MDYKNTVAIRKYPEGLYRTPYTVFVKNGFGHNIATIDCDNYYFYDRALFIQDRGLTIGMFPYFNVKCGGEYELIFESEVTK